jgi:TolB-like protein
VNEDGKSRLELLGPFRLLDPNNRRVDVTSKKAQALLAMLAVSGGGERTRTWLQDRLWGSRGQEQAQASLRNVLSSLKATLGNASVSWLLSDQHRVWIDLTKVDVDVRNMEGIDPYCGEFLEGLDLAGEEGFEEWLRDERARLRSLAIKVRQAPSPQAPIQAPVGAPVGAQVQNKSTRALISPQIVGFEALPALAVLPFTNLTGNSALDLLCEGMSEDLIDRLAKLKWLPIIARGSSFGFRGADHDPKRVGDQLGARYVLDGRLRHDGNQMILLATLTDTQTAQIVWSNRQSLNEDNPEVLQDLLTGFALNLGTKIDLQEQNRVMRLAQSDLNVRDLIWRGRWHLNRFTAQDSISAKACFTEALEQEPNSAEAIIQLTNAHLWDAWATRGTQHDIRMVRQMAQKAIVADYDDARGHMMSGISECFLRQPIRAEALLRRAIDLNPSLFLAHGYLGSTLYLNDDPAAALVSLNFAVRLSPNDQHLFHVLGELAICHFMLGDYERAISCADASTLRRPAYWFAHVIKINALSKQGNVAAAQAAYRDLTNASSRFNMSHIDWIPFCDRRWHLELKIGLNQAAAYSD